MRSKRQTIDETASAGGRVAQNDVADQVREAIVRGRLVPGSRLPTQADLANQFGASNVTIQRALTRLRHEGFVHARPGAGTFVVDHPPHENRYALVFPSRPSEQQIWSSFYRAMCEAVPTLNESVSPRWIELHFEAGNRPGNEAHDALLEEARRGQLAGILFAGTIENMDGSPLLQMPVPKVMIGHQDEQKHGDIPAVAPDKHEMLRRGLKTLAERGRKRVAVLTPPALLCEDDNNLDDVVMPIMTELGLATHHWWLLPVMPRHEEGLRRYAQLLMQGDPDQRPDGILLMDDHIVEPVCLGLLDLGLQTRRDLDLVGYCNFPLPPRAAMPYIQMGMDIPQMLRHMLRMIEAQREGKRPPMQTWVSPVTCDELSADSVRLKDAVLGNTSLSLSSV